ncbi:MAG: siderophore-interacting protein [Salibacteraceae bacterium]
MLSVKNKTQVSANMLRIAFEVDVPIDWLPGCYIKLRIPNALPGGISPVRTYTVRSYDAANQVLAVDFAIHQPAGPATAWALNAQPGDQIEYRGPGKLRVDPTNGDWHLFAADMSALPAAISIMESLSLDAKGYAFLEVTEEQDRQALHIPEGIQVQWLVHPNPKVKSNQQLEAIRNIKPLAGKPSVFVAGELSTTREIKQFLLQAPTYQSGSHYISSYWKIGLTEEEHKMAKRSAPAG